MTDDKATGQGGTQSLFIPLVLLIGGGIVLIAIGSIILVEHLGLIG